MSFDNNKDSDVILFSTSKRRSGSLVSRNITINNRRTSIRLEPDMWNGLREVCRREYMTMHEICSIIAAHKRKDSSLTAAIRVFIMAYFRAAATEDGHIKAGHGPGGHFMISMKNSLNTFQVFPSCPFEKREKLLSFR